MRLIGGERKKNTSLSKPSPTVEFCDQKSCLKTVFDHNGVQFSGRRSTAGHNLMVKNERVLRSPLYSFHTYHGLFLAEKWTLSLFFPQQQQQHPWLWTSLVVCSNNPLCNHGRGRRQRRCLSLSLSPLSLSPLSLSHTHTGTSNQSLFSSQSLGSGKVGVVSSLFSFPQFHHPPVHHHFAQPAIDCCV